VLNFHLLGIPVGVHLTFLFVALLGPRGGGWVDIAIWTAAAFVSILLHEMGHALGLTGHSPHPRDVMYKYVTQETRARLTPRDRTTLRELYSRPNGAPMPASSSVVY